MADQKFDASTIIELIHRHHGNLTAVAKSLKCNRQTVHNYIGRYPELQDAVQDERETMTDLAESKLYSALQKGHAWAIAFYLKTQGKSRGYIEKSQVDVHMDMSKLTDDELRSIAED